MTQGADNKLIEPDSLPPKISFTEGFQDKYDPSIPPNITEHDKGLRDLIAYKPGDIRGLDSQHTGDWLEKYAPAAAYTLAFNSYLSDPSEGSLAALLAAQEADPNFGAYRQDRLRDWFDKYAAGPLRNQLTANLQPSDVEQFELSMETLRQFTESPLGKFASALDEAIGKNPSLKSYAEQLSNWAIDAINKVRGK